MSVRTAILGRAQAFATITTLLAVVPAGETWIVKSVEVSPLGFGSSSVQVYATDPTAAIRVVFFQQTVATLTPVHYSGWVVLEPGDHLYCFPTSVDQYVWVSGARLAGVA